MKTVPPLNDLFNMAGLNLPNYLKGSEPTDGQDAAPAKSEINKADESPMP
jgi:flotillin